MGNRERTGERRRERGGGEEGEGKREIDNKTRKVGGYLPYQAAVRTRREL